MIVIKTLEKMKRQALLGGMQRTETGWDTAILISVWAVMVLIKFLRA